MKLVPLGDSAVLIQSGLSAGLAAPWVRQWAQVLETERLPGVLDVVPAFDTLAVIYDPAEMARGDETDPYEQVCRWIESRGAALRATSRTNAREYEIPVCYGGRHGVDLETVASNHGLEPAQAAKLHAGATYEVRAIGFSPGFPYLDGLPTALHTPRRPEPRIAVPRGSVAIGGTHTGIYSSETPGGWNLIGRTPWLLFDPRVDPPALLQIGDKVRFRPLAPQEYENAGEGPLPLRPNFSTREAVHERSDPAELVIERPGQLTTVQDLGRVHHRKHGVPQGGAADPFALRVGNLLVGNPEGAAALECTLSGPVVSFTRPTWVAVTGANVKGVTGWRPIRLEPGQVLSLGEFERGARAYVCVAGGLDVPPVLGSASTDLRGRFGGWAGRALHAGDRLPLGEGQTEFGDPSHWTTTTDFFPHYQPTAYVRVVAGPDWEEFGSDARETFTSAGFVVQPQSDRMGLRLGGVSLLGRAPGERSSQPVVVGTVQVPSGGQPLALLADAQTIGGYAQIAQVITVDLPVLAQLKAGDTVHFTLCSRKEAMTSFLARERALAKLREGLAEKLG